MQNYEKKHIYTNVCTCKGKKKWIHKIRLPLIICQLASINDIKKVDKK